MKEERQVGKVTARQEPQGTMPPVLQTHEHYFEFWQVCRACGFRMRMKTQASEYHG